MSDAADGTGGGPADFTSGQGAGVTIVEIQEEMESSFLDYAMSVIISRALPRRPRRAQACASTDPVVDVRPGASGPTGATSSALGSWAT